MDRSLRLPSVALCLALLLALPPLAAAAPSPSSTDKVQYPPRSVRRAPAAAASAAPADARAKASSASLGASPVPNLRVATVQVGQLPDAAVISPDDHWAYVLSVASNELDVIDLTFPYHLAHRIPLPYFLSAIQISPDGSELYIGAASPPISGYPTDGSCDTVDLPLTSSKVLFLSTASLTVTDAVEVSNLIIDLDLSPDGATLAASTELGLVLIDRKTHVSTAIPTTDVNGVTAQQAAAFAAGGAKVYAVHTFNELTVFDLASRKASAVAPPAGAQWVGANTSATPAGDKVFVDSCADDCSLTVIDGPSASLLAVVPFASQDAGLLTTRDGKRAYLPDGPAVLDLSTLRIVARGTPIGFGGAAGVLSLDESKLFVRMSGSAEFSLTSYGSPQLYDLAVISTTTMQTVNYAVLDPRPIRCSWPSPLRLNHKGNLLVAPNPTFNTVSIVDATPPLASPCRAADLCLQNRFALSLRYSTADGQANLGTGTLLSSTSAYFWFFSPTNLETLVKVVNGCALNDHYWVFVAGLTDVNAELTITDTTTGLSKTYLNPPATAFQPILDTTAFAACP